MLAYCDMDTEGESSDACIDSKLISSVSSPKMGREKQSQEKVRLALPRFFEYIVNGNSPELNMHTNLLWSQGPQPN